MPPGRLWVRGVTAGVLGATAMALWFLVVDASRGAPFRTPGLLAGSLLGVENFAGRPGLIALYTLVHYLVFAVVGVMVVWILPRTRVAPGALLGLVLGFILFDLVFYGSVWATGLNVVEELGWVEVLAGNILAGLTVMGYLHLTGGVRPATWWETLTEHATMREGLVAGVLGALAVAVWFLLVDLARGAPLFTPGALGSALFLGARSAEAIQISLWTVTGYTLLHFGVFAVVGLLVSALVHRAEETPTALLGGVLLFVAFEAFFLGFMAAMAEFLLGTLAWWAVAVGNGLAALAMGIYFWRRHPALRKALSDEPFRREAMA